MANTFTSINAAINKVTKVAAAEEGYLEKKSNSNLDSKKANAGYNNYTKYWRDLAKLGLVGGSQNFAGGPMWYWCAGFITWVFIQVFGVANATKLLLHMPFISCENMGTLANKAGRLKKSPKVGDVVLFWNGTRFSHTGYVYKVSATTFYTIEGNTNSNKGVVPNGGAVALKAYNILSYVAKGTRFFRPDYSIVVSKSTAPKKTDSKTPAKSVNKTVMVTVATKKDPLCCRKTPDGNKIGAFKKGSKIERLEKTNATWWKVKGKDMTTGKTITGYSASKYLKE